MSKEYNPWTGFLEDTATKVQDSAPVVGKKYTINGKEFKVLEVKGDNVKVLGSNGIVNHLSIKMFDAVPTIDKAIRNCDVKTSTRNVTTSNIAFEEIKKLSGVIPETVKEKGDIMEFYSKGVKVAQWDMNKAEVKVFV